MFKLALKELKFEPSGFGCNQTLFQSFALVFNSSIVFLFILKALDFHSKLFQNFNSHQKKVHLKVHLFMLMLLIFIFIHWYHHPGSSLSQIGSQISDQFSNFHGQSFSISFLNFSRVSSTLHSLSSLFSLLVFGLFVEFFVFQKSSSISFCFSESIVSIGSLLFIKKYK